MSVQCALKAGWGYRLLFSTLLFAGAIACAGWGYRLLSPLFAQLEQTRDGLNSMEGSLDQTSFGGIRSDGPLYFFVGASVTATCDDVYDSIRVTLEARNEGFDFSYTEIDGTDQNTGAMFLQKDCVKGSLGGVYSDLTAAASMQYAECKNADCGYDWYANPWPDDNNPIYDFQYKIISTTYKVSAISGYMVRLATEGAFGKVWEAAGIQFLGAFVCVLLGIGACVFMPGSPASDSPGTEMLS